VAGAEEKFFFHMHNFDDNVIDEPPPEEEVEDLPPPPPIFTEAELEAAKKKAFSEGHAQGIQETEASRAQALSNLMQRLANDTHTLFAAEAAREKTYEREVIALCKAVFEQVFPKAYEKHAFDAFITKVEQVLEAQHGQKAIHIRVSPEYSQGVTAFMDKLKSKNSELNFTVSSDESLQNGAFKMDWDDGGAVYDLTAITQAILANLDETLAGEGVPSHNEESKESNVLDDEVPIDASHNEPIAQDTTDDKTSENPIREDDNDG